MTLDERTLRAVQEARDRLLELEHEADRARVDFHHGLRRLHAAGGSLREIAEHFGMSHQRVHQIVDTGSDASRRKGRHVRTMDRIKDRVRDWGGFTRFTASARSVVTRAQLEARALGHDQIGSEHLLLALLQEDESADVAGRALRAMGVEHSSVRDEIVRAVGRGESVGGKAHLPFTPRAKKVLELSLREALALNHDYIGTEHILLALARDSSGLAGRVLRDLGAERARVSSEVRRLLGE